MYGDSEPPERASHYDVAQICLNGHIISDSINDFPSRAAAFCQRCGKSTITACPDCNAPIRGHYYVPGVISASVYDAPSFCYGCGAPYPWTRKGLDAARELADLSENLSTNDKETLKRNLDDLVTESPRTKVAELQFKQLMKKGGKDVYEGLKAILVDIVSETVKKSLFGPGA